MPSMRLPNWVISTQKKKTPKTKNKIKKENKKKNKIEKQIDKLLECEIS